MMSHKVLVALWVLPTNKDIAFLKSYYPRALFLLLLNICYLFIQMLILRTIFQDI